MLCLGPGFSLYIWALLTLCWVHSHKDSPLGSQDGNCQLPAAVAPAFLFHTNGKSLIGPGWVHVHIPEPITGAKGKDALWGSALGQCSSLEHRGWKWVDPERISVAFSGTAWMMKSKTSRILL